MGETKVTVLGKSNGSKDSLYETILKVDNERDVTPAEKSDNIAGDLPGTLGGVGLVGRMSKQVVDPFAYDRYRARQWPAGINLFQMAQLYAEHPDVYIACNKIVDKVCGQGWRIVKDNEAENPASDEVLFTARETFDGISGESPLLEELKRALLDRMLLGNAALEVSRNNKDEVSAVYWVPAQEVRVRMDNNGFVQWTAGGRYQMFNKYEPDAAVREQMRKDGTWHRMLTSDGRVDDPSMPYANEVIWWRAPNPLSRYYGLPPVYPAMKDILLDASAKISNLAFFENGMMPDWAVLVNGGSLTAESIQQIEDFLTDAHSGADKHHGMLYIAALPEMGGNAVKVEMVPLNAPHKDMAFKELHEASRDTILRCWGLSPGKAGVQSMGALGGGTNLMAETDSFKFEVVEPIQTRVEYSFNRILRLDFGFEGLLFEFAELDLKEERQNVEMATRAVGGSPFITVNEARAMIGLPILVGEGYDKIPEPKQDTGPYAVGGVRRLHDPEQPVRKPATEEAAEGKKAADK